MTGSGGGDRSRGPRPLGDSLARLVAADAPPTLLAEVQTAWERACGSEIAANSEPVAERQGTVTVACASGAWAQELELMQGALKARLDAVVGEGRLLRLRFTADLARHR